tara:strand:+ start:24406 stop:24663 length:258 start_codon:yes stop_codon:yes gene_type:complete
MKPTKINPSAFIEFDAEGDDAANGNVVGMDAWTSLAEGKTPDEAAKAMTEALMEAAMFEERPTAAAVIYGAVHLLLEVAQRPKVA